MNNDEIYAELEDSAKCWVNERVSLLNKSFMLWLVFVICAVVVPTIAIFIKPDLQPMNTWFQRGGSILVMFSVLAEVQANSIEKFAIKKGYPGLYCDIFLVNKYERNIKLIKYASHVLIFIGTAIWGYGDVIYSYFK
jgi:hypothetical protein